MVTVKRLAWRESGFDIEISLYGDIKLFMSVGDTPDLNCTITELVGFAPPWRRARIAGDSPLFFQTACTAFPPLADLPDGPDKSTDPASSKPQVAPRYRMKTVAGYLMIMFNRSFLVIDTIGYHLRLYVSTVFPNGMFDGMELPGRQFIWDAGLSTNLSGIPAIQALVRTAASRKGQSFCLPASSFQSTVGTLSRHHG
jgi:hypothetical protein